jgi:hypothetical protein
MTYATNNVIQAGDPNNFLTGTTNNLNRLWGTGGGDFGYNQAGTRSPSPYPTVTTGEVVRVNPWLELYEGIHRMGAHQGVTVSNRSANFPTQAELVRWFSNVQADLDTVTNNRRNAAAQGSTFSNSDSIGGWNNYCYYYINYNFADYDSMRYFFNAGGQIGFSMAHGRTTRANALVNSLCSNLGTVWISSASNATLAGTTYSGMTRFSGNGGSENNGLGFHALSGSDQALVSTVRSSSTYNSINTRDIFNARGQYVRTNYIWGGDYTPNSYLSAFARVSGGTLTVTVLIDIVNGGSWTGTASVINAVNDGNADIGNGLTATGTVRMPSTNQFTDVWGTPSITFSNTRV